MNWRAELYKAAITFAITVGASFALTQDVTDWQTWAIATVLAASRVAVSQLVAAIMVRE